MQPGTIVEYIDHKHIITAAVLDHKNKKLRMLTMQNREVSHGETRLAHVSEDRIDVGLARSQIVEQLRGLKEKRETLKTQVNLKDLWEVVHTEPAWIDVKTMAELCFDSEVSSDHTSAVMRAMFEDRFYFKFDGTRFFPNSPEKVDQIAGQVTAENKKAHLISEATRWIQHVMETGQCAVPTHNEEIKAEIIDTLVSFYLFGKDSPHQKVAKEIISQSPLDPHQGLFDFLVRVGVWNPDENVTLHRLEISSTFPGPVLEAASHLIKQKTDILSTQDRKDLRHLSTITIDGQNTLDFDDAISIEPLQRGCKMWIHVTDVCHLLKRGDPVDDEAFGRASSIYLPDTRISMLPPILTEDLCSLRQGEDRFAITVVVELSDSAEVLRYEVFPSIIRVNRQLSYYDTNQIIGQDQELQFIYEYAQKLNARRLDLGALQINLPEINVWINDDNEISITRTNRESPSRVMVSEAMILANWLIASYFKDRGQPAVFRTQAPPRQRLIDGKGGSLYQNWMQRRFLSRVVLTTDPEPHAGLGLDAYLTITSPLRKYLDLVTQRQLWGLLGMGHLYSEDELTFVIQSVREPLSRILFLQQERKRYWILKYLETAVGSREEALVLEKRRQHYVLLLTNYMMETTIPLQGTKALTPEETITVVIDHADARADKLTVSIA